MRLLVHFRSDMCVLLFGVSDDWLKGVKADFSRWHRHVVLAVQRG